MFMPLVKLLVVMSTWQKIFMSSYYSKWILHAYILRDLAGRAKSNSCFGWTSHLSVVWFGFALLCQLNIKGDLME